MEADVKLKALKRKVVPIIRYQPDRQWTPRELVEQMLSDPETDDLQELIVIATHKDGDIGIFPASKNRDLQNCKMLWNLELAKICLLEED